MRQTAAHILAPPSPGRALCVPAQEMVAAWKITKRHTRLGIEAQKKEKEEKEKQKQNVGLGGFAGYGDSDEDGGERRFTGTRDDEKDRGITITSTSYSSRLTRTTSALSSKAPTVRYTYRSIRY